MQYLIYRREGMLVAWSSQRLPNEPKGWLREYKVDLQAALRALPSKDGVLIATFAQPPTPRAFDVENILFYNVRHSNFEHLAQHGIAFRRVAPCAAPGELNRSDAPVCMTYQIGPVPDWLDHSEALASFTLAQENLNANTKPADVWWSANAASTRDQPFTGPFGLRIHVSPPNDRANRPAAYLKPLVDGVIAALQIDANKDEAALDVAAAHLAAHLNVTKSDVITRLRDGAEVISSESALVRPYRGGVQWNPADDACAAVVLTVAEPTGANFSIVGTLHAFTEVG